MAELTPGLSGDTLPPQMQDTSLPSSYQVASLAQPQYVVPNVDPISPQITLDKLVGNGKKYYGSNQECVSAGQAVSGLPQTSDWLPGGNIGTDTQIGAPIATFGSDGKYKNQY